MPNNQQRTHKLKLAKAWASGYKTGMAGNELASPPYMNSEFTEPLIREWKLGQEAGLIDRKEYLRTHVVAAEAR